MSLLVEDVGPVRILTLNRPEKRNAFDSSIADGLWTELARASEDAGCRAVVVTGAGELFTAGVDVSVFLGMQGGDIEAFRKLGFLHEPIRACTKPTIAMVQGPAVGMGVTLLPHFDLVYAADHATFMVPFVKLGLLVEFGGSFTLPRLIGLSRTKELVLRGKPIDARTASEWGLVTRVFPRSPCAPRCSRSRTTSRPSPRARCASAVACSISAGSRRWRRPSPPRTRRSPSVTAARRTSRR